MEKRKEIFESHHFGDVSSLFFGWMMISMPITPEFQASCPPEEISWFPNPKQNLSSKNIVSKPQKGGDVFRKPNKRDAELSLLNKQAIPMIQLFRHAMWIDDLKTGSISKVFFLQKSFHSSLLIHPVYHKSLFQRHLEKCMGSMDWIKVVRKIHGLLNVGRAPFSLSFSWIKICTLQYYHIDM